MGGDGDDDDVVDAVALWDAEDAGDLGGEVPACSLIPRRDLVMAMMMPMSTLLCDGMLKDSDDASSRVRAACRRTLAPLRLGSASISSTMLRVPAITGVSRSHRPGKR